MTATPIICVHCRQPCVRRFEITRFDSSGSPQPTVVACSITHMIAWAYEYATLNGMRLAFGAKSSFENFMRALKGEKP